MDREQVLANLAFMTANEIVDALWLEVIQLKDVDRSEALSYLKKKRVRKLLRQRQENLRKYERKDPAGPLPLPSDHFGSSVESALSEEILGSLVGATAGIATKGIIYDDPSLDDGRDQVYSALYAPSSVQQSSWFRVQVHLYDRRIASSVSRNAKALDKNATLKGKTALSMDIERGTVVKAELRAYDEGALIPRASRTLVWKGVLTTAVFEVKVVDGSLASVAGEVELSIGDVPVGLLTFDTEVFPKVPGTVQSCLGEAKPVSKVFFSYSHKDVKAVKLMASV